VTTTYASKSKILVDEIELSEATLPLEIGEDETLTVDDYSPPNQDEIELGVNEPAVTWHSSNPAVATVDESTGEVTAVANGTALITATITPPKSGIPVTGTCEVTVVPADAQSDDLYNLTVMSGKFSATNVASAKMSIVADPAPSGQAFDKWEVTSGTDGNFFEDKYSATTVLTMPAENVTVTATYENVYALTVLNGTDNSGVGSYAEGDVVSITANAPDPGKVFDKWTSDPTGVVFTNANSSTTTFAMPPNPVTITATYKDAPPPPTAPTTYAVTVTGGSGSASYEANATVTITANAPADGKVFDTWTTNDGVTFADPNSVVTTFVMPAKKVTVTATYADDPQGTGGDPENPTVTDGWAYEDGVWKFFIDDVAQTGWLYDDAWYYLNADGIMQTGWLYDSNYKAWYYLSGNGAMKTGGVKDDGSWYYLKGDGAMVAAKWLHDADDSWYYLSGNGKMLTGKRTIGGKTYMFKANGVMMS
jgi:hypothetical protein